MSRTSQQLEAEIAAMENRLAAAKVTVHVEQEAWKKVARKGKRGTKWKGAAAPSKPTSSRSEMENESGEIVLEPKCWDALELAQHLQARQLGAFAAVVVAEQITGKLLLETPPGKLRALFKDCLQNGSSWNELVKNCSELHQLQKKLETPTPTADKPAKPTLFPVISPRMPALTASSLATKSGKPVATSITAHIGGADAPERLKTPASHGSMFRRAKKTSSTSSSAAAATAMATCWNCSARFPRPKQSSTVPTPRLYCSRACQDAIEAGDMAVSASLSLHAETATLVVLKPPGSLAAVVKSPRHRTVTPAPAEQFDFLHVAPRGPPAAQPPRQSSMRKRLGAAPQVSSSSSTGGALSPVASITSVRALPETLLGVQSNTFQSRVFQQSKYRLDPELFQVNGVSWTNCFDPSSSATTATATTNLETLVGFLSVKALYYLSLSCHKWFGLVHVHPATCDRVWNVLLHRTWREPELSDLGIVGKNKKPRRAMMKLTRQLQRTVLENMKTLLQAENWQLADVCRNEAEYLPCSVSRLTSEPPEPLDPTVDRGNDLYEVITVIYDASGVIIAIQARELLRPVAEDGVSTLEILQGLQSGRLGSVLCRRLRLFSLANRLPFSEWYLLPEVLVVFEFCDAGNSSPPLSTWQWRVLERLQAHMSKRLLGKESVQQLMKRTSELAPPQEALDAMELFLVRLAPALLGKHRRSNP